MAMFCGRISTPLKVNEGCNVLFLTLSFLTCPLFFQDSCNKLNRGTSSYLDPIAVGGFILREGSRDIDWVWPVVDRLNLSFFTSVVWSNSGSYDEAISVFFQLLVPEHLHDRDEVIDMFLDLVTRRKLGEKGWPTDEYTMQEVVNKMKEDIENDMEDEDQSLRERVLNAFNKRYGHVCCYDRDPNGVFFIILLVRWIRCHGMIWSI